MSRPMLVRVLYRVAAGLCTLVTFVVAAAIGVLLHLDLPSARRVARAQVDALLRPTFQGTIEIDGLERLRLTGASGLSGRITDPDGVPVLIAQGIAARVSLFGILRSALFGKSEIDIALSELTVDHVDLNLDIAPDGVLRLLHAVEPKEAKGGAGTGPSVRLALDDVTINHAWVHGPVDGRPIIDVEAVTLRASALVHSRQVLVDVLHVTFSARGLPKGANLEGEVQAHLAVPSKTGKDVGAELDFKGTLGTVPITAVGQIEGRHIDATVDVPEVAADRVRATIPEVPLQVPVSVHAEAHSDLPELEGTMHVVAGTGVVDAHAKVGLTDAPKVQIDARADGIDLRAFLPTAPASRLGANVTASFAASGDGAPVGGNFSVDVPRGVIGKQTVPSAKFGGDFTVERSGTHAVSGHAHGTIAEEGAPTEVTLALSGTASSPVLAFDATLSLPSLAELRRVNGMPKGRGRAQIRGSYSISGARLDATVAAHVDDLDAVAAYVSSADFNGHLSGPVRALALQSSLHAEGVHAGPLNFEVADAKTDGPLVTQTATVLMKGVNSPDIDASGEVDVLGMTVRTPKLSARRDGVSALLRADTARWADQELALAGVVLEGLGEPIRADVSMTKGQATVRAVGHEIDVGRVAHLCGLSDLIKGGLLALDVDMDARRDGASGRLVVDLDHGAVGAFDNVAAHLDASMSGRSITGQGQARVGDIGSLRVTPSVLHVAGGGPLELDSWRKMWGAVSVTGMMDLARLARIVSSDSWPFDETAGQVYFEVHVARDSESDYTPELAVSARTHGLVLGSKKNETPWRSSGVDVELDTRIDGDTGFIELAGRLTDSRGVLAGLDAKSNSLPFAEMMGGSSSLSELLLETPFAATLVVPRHRIDALPAALPVVDANGEFEATLQMVGTVREPQLDLHFRGYDLKLGDAPRSVAMAADLAAHYDGQNADLTLKLRSPKEQVLEATGRLSLPATSLLRGLSDDWGASTSVALTRFPLAAFPSLEDRAIRGHVSGTLALTDLHRAAKAALSAKIDDLRMGRTAYTGGGLDITADGRSLSADVQLAQPEGSLEVKTRLGVLWGSHLVPRFDGTQKVTASVFAKHFAASAFLPFTLRTLSELDGVVDGSASVELDPALASAKMQGLITLENGTFQLVSTGQEFHKARATLSLSPDGILKLDDVTAYGLSGRLMASGVARLNGLRLQEARLAIRIPKGQAIPFDADGVEVGTVDGDWTLVATSPSPKLMKVDVEVPTMHVELPTTSTHDVQALDPPQNVRVGVYRGREPQALAIVKPEDIEEAAPDRDRTEIDVAVHLGQDVEVRRGANLKVALGGAPIVKVSDNVNVSGQVFLKSGTLDVQGKRFEIEKGTVTFVGDNITNPQVVVTANWTAPDGTRVYADFVGPLQTGKVTLRSEPTLPKNEILALILFGTTDGGVSSSASTSTASTAGAAASGFATEGLSRGLDQLTGLDVSTRIDTSNATNPRPEVEVQIARAISLQVAYVLGTPPPGQNPDNTFATINWRFVRNWSLATTFGDKGSSMADVVWQYRY